MDRTDRARELFDLPFQRARDVERVEETGERRGDTVGAASVVVRSAGTECAKARGVYELDR